MPLLHGVASTYSSCVEQPVQRLFFALTARKNYKVYGGDAQDAHTHSPPPETPIFVSIDDAYTDWYEHRFKKQLDRSLALPVLHALQGHPKSGKLWEKHITAILQSPQFGFKSTTHDRSIYLAAFEGTKILLLCQVDNFAVACPNEELAKHLCDQIGKRSQLTSEDAPPFKHLGLFQDFNGLDIAQCSDAIKLSCEKCIDQVLTTHRWSKPSPHVPLKPPAQLLVDAATSLYAHQGPPENTTKHAALMSKHGFVCRKLLGKLLCAHVTCRPDIGYATITASKFSTYPHDHHFSMLKKVAKHLRATKDWSIIYHWSQPDTLLLPFSFIHLTMDADFPDFLHVDPQEPIAFLDAAHTNDLQNCRSAAGYALLLCGRAISNWCKTQSITATSSTESEFLSAVTTAKHARYVRVIMTDLGFPPNGPTVICCDNQSAINMINGCVATERSRHIDIQRFAMQEWKELGAIVMEFISCVINPSDDLTKPLGWVLHDRHARRIMGHW